MQGLTRFLYVSAPPEKLEDLVTPEPATRTGSKTKSTNESFQKTQMMQLLLQKFSTCSVDFQEINDFLANSLNKARSRRSFYLQLRGRCQWGYPLEAFELDSLGPFQQNDRTMKYEQWTNGCQLLNTYEYTILINDKSDNIFN